MSTIAAKLNRIYLLVAISVLFTVSLISQAYIYLHGRAVAHETLSTQAAALAGNLESAVTFGDAYFAQQILNALQHYPEVRMAVVILPDGKSFASYPANRSVNDDDAIKQYLIRGDFVAIEKHGVIQSIAQQGNSPARLVIVASLEDLNREALLIFFASVGLCALILCAAYIVFQRFSGAVIHPLEKLTSVMHTVEREGDRGQRALVVSDDEFGELATGFNAMLSSLEAKSCSLTAELEERKRAETVTQATKNQLQATLDAIPDLMFEVGLDGRYFDYHSQNVALLAAPPEMLIGSKVSDVLPADAADVCMRALQEAHANGQSRGRQYALTLSQGPRWFELSVARKAVAAGEDPRFIVLSRDITERKIAEDEVKNLAYYDPLTQLPNRRLLFDRLTHAMTSSTRSERHGALLFIDLDDFKTVNDSLGHDQGDLLLQEAAQRLTACVRDDDTVARLGGDEFVVMLEGLSKDERDAATQAKRVGKKILARLNLPYSFNGHTQHSSASAGVTMFCNHRDTIDDLLKQADMAMYQAKAAGRNALRFFDTEMQVAVMTRAALEEDLHEALRGDQFLLYYQPQVIGESSLIGVEALVRWQHPQRGLVPPIEFITLAEDTGLILPLGQWVLETACTQLAVWAGRPKMEHLTVAVNVSARQFHQHGFVDQVLAALERTGANPQRLKLELTESMLVNDIEGVIAKMTSLKDKGVSFSLDDFGTGYSSLAYLKRLPLDQLKIDQGFIRNILSDVNDAAIAKMVIALAKNLGITVIAEGVETKAQQDHLAFIGCPACQGYLFGRPLPLDAFEELVARYGRAVLRPQMT